MKSDKIIINGLRLFAYHGVNDEEKTQGQYFVLDIVCFLSLEKPCLSDSVEDTVSYADVIKTVRRHFTRKKYDLIESAASAVASGILEEFCRISRVTVTLKKPDAPVKADFEYAAVELERERAVRKEVEAYLGLGANLGDREKSLKSAICALRRLPDTAVEGVSSVYETQAWGNKNQPSFLNICVKLRTSLSERALLGACLGIEAAIGRDRSFKYAPRVIDIDLLLYGTSECTSKELTLPHPLIGERAFVLVPLKELLPDLRLGAADYSKCLDRLSEQGVRKIGSLGE